MCIRDRLDVIRKLKSQVSEDGVGKNYLVQKDKKLGRLIKSYPKDFLFTKSDPFLTLARSIVGQQISVKAAQSVWDKLIDIIAHYYLTHDKMNISDFKTMTKTTRKNAIPLLELLDKMKITERDGDARIKGEACA